MLVQFLEGEANTRTRDQLSTFKLDLTIGSIVNEVKAGCIVENVMFEIFTRH